MSETVQALRRGQSPESFSDSAGLQSISHLFAELVQFLCPWFEGSSCALTLNYARVGLELTFLSQSSVPCVHSMTLPCAFTNL